MVVIDQFSRRIIGFAVHIGDPDGKAYCVMFNKIISGKPPPKYLSSDNDFLFLFYRWKANLRILDLLPRLHVGRSARKYSAVFE